MKKQKKIGIIILALIIFSSLFIFIEFHESETIGSESTGYVVKNTYSHYPNPNSKIAIVSGMHPRETLSTSILPYVVKIYAALNNVEIINYQITVLDSPEDFYRGRGNGEQLVHDYVVKDISKSNIDLVIIGHDHEPGYGEGFYIATPSMDDKSVKLATDVMSDLSDFNYYKREVNQTPKSSSIIKVDNPIVATGTPLFVYEIPEWIGFHEVFIKSYSLIDSSLKNIN